MVKVISARGYRVGRGFSLGEIKSAGLSMAQAKRMKIRVDARRVSLHDFNVEELKEMASKHPQPAKASAKSKVEKKKEAGIKTKEIKPAVEEAEHAKKTKAKSKSAPKKKDAG